MKWITREKVKVDRVACPWLIQRFIDPQAELVFVAPNQVEAKARELGATAFDIEDCELGHHGLDVSEEFNDAAPMGFSRAVLVLLPLFDGGVRDLNVHHFGQFAPCSPKIDPLLANVFAKGLGWVRQAQTNRC